MKNVSDPTATISQARETLRIEGHAILALADRLDERFPRAVALLLATPGRVVVTGMGKSGLIGKKIAATLASTGTPAFFLHPAEGSHGDIGMVTSRDAVIAISNSGNTEEVLALVPVIKRLGLPLIGLVGNCDSLLGRMSDVALDVGVEREACPMGLAPTTSTTAALAMGDALAVALLHERHFTPDQFALLHPGGTLGRRLLARVSDLMHSGERIPMIGAQTTLREAVLEMTAKRMGMTGIADSAGELVGIITDGDLRRLLEREEQQRRVHPAEPSPPLLERPVLEVMSRSPRSIPVAALAVEAVRMMEQHKITSLFARDEQGVVCGVIHLHDLIAAGLM